MSSILQKLSPFTHYMENEALLRRRKKLDISLTAIYCAVLLAYAVFTGYVGDVSVFLTQPLN